MSGSPSGEGCCILHAPFFDTNLSSSHLLLLLLLNSIALVLDMNAAAVANPGQADPMLCDVRH